MIESICEVGVVSGEVSVRKSQKLKHSRSNERVVMCRTILCI